MTETSTYTHQELSARLAEVEWERDEAAAMVGRLNGICKSVSNDLRMRAGDDDDGLSVVDISDFIWQDLCAVELGKLTPPAALQEIRAEAGTAGYLKGFRDYCSRMWPSEQEFIDGPLADYAQQLRNGEQQ